VTTDLTPFTWINPCGLENVAMTSLKAEGAGDVSVGAVRQAMVASLSDVFSVAIREVTAEEFEKRTAALP
jgi:lipoyl(octanoyl) transferase